jgi:multidrug efflux pump subunit AcrA (membrane-fusion protein)
MRRPGSILGLLLGLALVGWLGAGPSGASEVDRALADEDPDQAGPSQGDSWTGLLIPLNATDLYGPESGFRISGWSSWGGPLKLLELAPEGQQVEQGAVIARFEFNGKDAQRWILERLQRAQADAAQAKIRADQTLEGLGVDQRRRALEAERAGIDVQKERAISRRQAALFRIAHQLAVFETEAIAQRLHSAGRSREAELTFHEQTLKRTGHDQARYVFYENRFMLTAPHDGVVRHAYNSRERRKFQKGDSVQAGQRLISVAKDQALAARFFVPEHRIWEVREGAEVTVVSPASGEEHRAVVRKIDFFPQELGFLMELPTLPNAREKAFAVVAEFVSPPSGLSAGTELRVKGGRR